MKNKATNKPAVTEYADTKAQVLQRQALVANIAANGITDVNVLTAIGKLPRQFFMPAGMQADAYTDRAFPIGEGQTISQPYTVAYQTQLLRVHPGDKILEVGTGSAYQAAVLAMMGAIVYTIERQKKLYNRATHFSYLQTLPGLHFCYGDGFEGWPAEAPFDKVLVTAAPNAVPPALTAQLRPGGTLVAPVGLKGLQRMIRITKGEDGQLTEELFEQFSFVPMLRGKVE